MTHEVDKRDLMHLRARLVGPDGIVREIDEDVAALAVVTNDFRGLQEAVLAHGGKFAYWSTLEVIAADSEQTAKDALDALEAEILSEMGDEKTVTAAKAKMRTDPRWKALHEAWRSAQRTAAMIRVGRKTVEEHKDALREAGQNFRAEMESLLQVRRGGGDLARDAEAAERAMQAFVDEKRGKR